nr:tyrosine-type recombinase/integrase [Novosphingobium aquimarinum]
MWHSASEEGYPFGNFVQLLILTGQRRGEMLGATLGEFAISARVWTIPGDRAKNGKANIVPLSPQALEVVEGVIASARPGSDDPSHMHRLVFASESSAQNPVSGITRAWNRMRKRRQNHGVRS